MAYENDTGYPSATDIMKPYIDDRWYTGDCLIRGTAVHACIANHLLGLYSPRLKPEYQQYVDCFKPWIDENVDEVLKVEIRLVDDDMRYCGQPDAILRLHGQEKPCVIDWKTGKAVQRSHKIQLAAYAHLTATDAGGDMGDYECIIVRPNTSLSKALATKFLDSSRDFNIFRGMLKSYQFFNDKVPRMHCMEKI